MPSASRAEPSHAQAIPSHGTVQKPGERQHNEKQIGEHQPAEEKKKPSKAERRATQDRQRAEKAAAKVLLDSCAAKVKPSTSE